jgi:hypothetical protein
VSTGAQRWRVALFGACSFGLCLAAIYFASSSPDHAVAPAKVPIAPRASSSERGAALLAKLRSQARRFLRAFLRYEAGESDRRLRRALRAGSSLTFAAELLATPPRLPSRRLATARLGRISVTLIPSAPPRALVSATATRPIGPEHLSFLFDLHAGRWLARGLGE